jgi:hypothetical protein
MTNFFRTKIAPGAMLLGAVLGGSACSNPFAGEDDGIKECPDKYETVSIEVDGAAPVIRAFASLAQDTVLDYSNQDPYDLSNSSIVDDGDSENVDEANEVVCVVGTKVYLSARSISIVGAAESDGYEFDFNSGTAKIPEATEE